MIRSLFWKLWNTPPALVYARLLYAFRRALTGSRPEWHTVRSGPLEGGRLCLILNGSPDSPEMIDGRYDKFLFEAAAGTRGIEDATVWDVGAHIGYHTLNFAAMVGPRGHVVAFEPNPANAARLRANLAGNPDLEDRITVAEMPLCGTDGEQDFLFSSGVDSGKSQNSHLSDASLPLNKREYLGYSQKKLLGRCIDSLIEEGNYGIPDLIKIDVEGAESLVLAGAQLLLHRQPPHLLIEIHNVTNMFHVQRILNRLGYEIKLLDEENAGLSRCFLSAAVSRAEVKDADRQTKQNPIEVFQS